MKSESTVRQLVDKISSGELLLPEMQRGYVWKSTHVRNLFDSLYRGYPSGVILAWETDLPVETRDFAVQSGDSPVRPLLLLDGQQRLTSLSAVLDGKGVSVRDRKREIRLLFNLDHPDELPFVTSQNDNSPTDVEIDVRERLNRMAFVVYTKQLAAQSQWVDVSDIFSKSDADILRQSGVTSFDDPRYDRYVERLKAVRAIQDYVYRIDILDRKMSYEEVTEIFVRVNSLGIKLRSSDLALAQITARWRGSLEQFTMYQKKLTTIGFNVDLAILLRTLITLTTGQSRFYATSSLSLEQLRTGWNRTVKAIDFAVDYLRSNVAIDSMILLSSPYFLIATAFWADSLNFDITSEAETSFRRWLLTANAKTRYSGSSETKLDQDISVMKRGGDGKALLERLRNDVGRLDFTSSEVAGRSTRHGVFKTLFMALRSDGVVDWYSDLIISPTHTGKSSKIEFHHIFPRAYLKRTRKDLSKAEIDQIANMAFISSSTNRHIRDRAPHEYREKIAPQRLNEQLIDFNDGRDLPENYEDFISRRLELIAARINDYLEIPSQDHTITDSI